MSDLSITGQAITSFLRTEAKDKQRLEEEGIDLTQPHVVIPVDISRFPQHVREHMRKESMRRGITIGQYIASAVMKRSILAIRKKEVEE